MHKKLLLTPFAVRREQELKQLYEKIAREFPFVAKQGLKPGQKVSELGGELPRAFEERMDLAKQQPENCLNLNIISA